MRTQAEVQGASVRPTGEAEADFREIFVVGASRSGTTLLGRIIGRNKAVKFFRELHFFEEIWTPEENARPWSMQEARAALIKLLRIQQHGYLQYSSHPLESAHEKTADDILASMGDTPLLPHLVHSAFLRHLSRSEGNRASVEHTPAYSLYATEILKLYPNARMIHIVRDPRDVLTSQRHKWRRRRMNPNESGFSRRETVRAWANYHPWLTANLWKAAVEGVQGVEKSGRVLTVRFEDLAAMPEQETRRICAFLGLDYDRDMLNVPSSNSSKTVNVPGALGINKDMARSTWPERLPKGDIAICERIAGPLMRGYGYETKTSSRPLASAWSMLSLLPKSALSLALNLERTRNLGKSIKRRFFRKSGGRRIAAT